jgi:hypothetical protein
MPDDEYFGAHDDIPLVYRTLDSEGYTRQRVASSINGGQYGRSRVPLTECWYKTPVRAQRIFTNGWAPDLDGKWYDPEDPRMKALVAEGKAELATGTRERMCFALFVPGTMLVCGPSPFRHNAFPYTPIWCKRRARDGMPYGMIRGARDAQKDLNKRMSKALFLLSSNFVISEKGAILEGDVDTMREEANKPNGWITVETGFFDKIKIERNSDISQYQVQLADFDAAHIHDSTGVNRENMGRDTNATSGKAIVAKQQEGAVTTAEVFDNYRLHYQESGSKTLSLIEQFVRAERQFRVTGDQNALSFVKVNVPVWDAETGQWRYENDLTEREADFVIDQTDWRESIRAAMATEIAEIIRGLPPEIAAKLVDIPLMFMDFAEKDTVLARVRAAIGVAPDGSPQPDPLAERERIANVEKIESEARKNHATADDLELKTKGESMNVAAAVAAAPHLTRAADALSGKAPAQAPVPTPPNAAPPPDRLLSDEAPPAGDAAGMAPPR